MAGEAATCWILSMVKTFSCIYIIANGRFLWTQVSTLNATFALKYPRLL